MSGKLARNAWPMVPVGELLKSVRRPVDVRNDATYREIGIRSHCKGIFHKPPTTAPRSEASVSSGSSPVASSSTSYLPGSKLLR